MLHPTRAVVLRQTRYGETSLIVRMYTETFGVQSYIVNGVRSAKSRTHAALYQPPNMLDLVVYHTEGRDLHRIREARPLHVYQRIPFEIGHSSVALFLTEVLGKCLRDEHHGDDGNEHLFKFLEATLLNLDACEHGLSAFPALFLLGLSQQMGFQPQGRFGGQTPWFDLQEGYFTAQRPLHGYAMMPEEGALLYQLLQQRLHDPKPMLLPASQRQLLLDNLLLYFRFHIEGFGQLRSPAILQDVLNRRG